MADTQKVDKVMDRWLREKTMLRALVGVRVTRNCAPAMASIRGQLTLVPGADMAVIKSHAGAFVNIVAWGLAKSISVARSWRGTIIEVQFGNAILVVSDYEPVEPF